MTSELPNNIPDLAGRLGITPEFLRLLIYRTGHHYKTFRVHKRSGYGYRVICAPSPELKGVQRWIVVHILRHIPLPAACTAFRPGSSILSNAAPHVGQDFVCGIDLKDFFPSISTKRVHGLFRRIGLAPQVAYAIARLCTYRGALPQGAPSSPEIANLTCRKLDARLGGLCAKRGWAYTRYCDDITISGKGNIGRSLDVVKSIVKEEGFELNPRKLRVKRRNSQQRVTGLVVNERPSIPRCCRRAVRATFHQADMAPVRFSGRAAELAGHIAFLSMVQPNDSAIDRYREILCKVVEIASRSLSSD